MRAILSLYSLRLPFYLVYMLQQVEYEPKKFSEWFRRLLKENRPIQTVMHRKKLVMTRRAMLLIISTYLIATLVTVLYVWFVTPTVGLPLAVGAILLAMPQIIRGFIWLQAVFAHALIVRRQQSRMLAEATKLFANHKGVKVAVLGSYGKTTMKEILVTVLSESKKLAATPGNMNVSLSHARFARTLCGDEEVVIVEFGEGEPGDIDRMAQMFTPEYAVLTGLAPNHLDHYPNLQAVADDLLTIREFVTPEKLFINNEPASFKPYIGDDKVANYYSSSSVHGWKVEAVTVDVNHLSFTAKKGKKKLQLTSSLVGRHQIGPLMVAVALAELLGMTNEDIKRGVGRTQPFDHRMQARTINGAWIIDDTYNGNIEGLRAGLAYLSEVEATRKWYVTPGLVDQGAETERVHKLLGELIADAKPDIVVLMDNSVMPIIRDKMIEKGYAGELRIVTDPLDFYTTIDQHVAAGDLVLMQNDWTDNYS